MPAAAATAITPDTPQLPFQHHRSRGLFVMTMLEPKTDGVLQTSYQRSVAAYWNDNPNDDRINTKLGEVDDLYHHHYGIGRPDLSVLEGPEDTRQDRLVRELHRLETAQADLLL